MEVDWRQLPLPLHERPAQHCCQLTDLRVWHQQAKQQAQDTRDAFVADNGPSSSDLQAGRHICTPSAICIADPAGCGCVGSKVLAFDASTCRGSWDGCWTMLWRPCSDMPMAPGSRAAGARCSLRLVGRAPQPHSTGASGCVQTCRACRYVPAESKQTRACLVSVIKGTAPFGLKHGVQRPSPVTLVWLAGAVEGADTG